MNILIGCSLYFDLEGSVGGFVAVGHVAVGATALSRLQRRGGIIELTLRDQHVDMGEAVGSVKSESDAVGYVSGLPIGHDHGQVLLELSNAGVGRGAVFGCEILTDIGHSSGIGFHPALIFGEVVALSPQHGARKARAQRQTKGKFHGVVLSTRFSDLIFRASYASPTPDTIYRPARCMVAAGRSMKSGGILRLRVPTGSRKYASR